MKRGARGVGALVAVTVLAHCGRATVPHEDADEPRASPSPVPPAEVDRSDPAPPPAASGNPGGGTSTPPPESKPEPRSIQAFEATADADVDETRPDQDFSNSDTLRVGRSPQRRAYLRFDVGGLKGSVTRAKLRLYATGATDHGPHVVLPSGGFLGESLTWNKAPFVDNPAPEDTEAIVSDSWVEYDVTPTVIGSGVYFFALLGNSSSGVSFASRESSLAQRRPQLVLTTTPLPACMPRTLTRVIEEPVGMNGYASEDEPTAVFALPPSLRVKSAPARLESYLEFSYWSVHQWSPRSVKLRLYATQGTSDGPALHPASTSWPLDWRGLESFNWNTRPALLGPAVDNLGAIEPNTWVEYDVTSAAARPNMPYAFGLLPESSDEVDFAPSNSSQRPLVRVTLESDPYCTYRGAGGGMLQWARQEGGAGQERLDMLATDAQGGFVTAGLFGEASFPDGVGLALARYSATGTPLWTRQVTTQDVHVKALTVTPEGNLLVVGQYTGSPDLGAGPLPAACCSKALFIAKFSPGGQTVWSHGYLNTRTHPRDYSGLPVVPTQVATDAQGSLLVSGSFSGTLDLGGGPLVSNSTFVQDEYGPEVGGFVAKFDGQGQHVWSRVLEGSRNASAMVLDVSTDASGNLFLSGSLSDQSRLGEDLDLKPGQQWAPFIAKYTPSGTLVWKRMFPQTYGLVWAARPGVQTGQVAFLASLGESFSFGGKPYRGGVPTGDPGGANVSSFLGALSATGEDGWLEQLPFSVRQLQVGGDGGLTLINGVGEDLGGGVLGQADAGGPLLAHYSATGAHLWSRLFDSSLGVEDVNTPLKVAPLPGGGTLVGGTFSQPLPLEGTSYSPRGSSDLLYLRLGP